MPVITGYEAIDVYKQHVVESDASVCIMKNYMCGKEVLKMNAYEQKIVFSYGIHLDDEQIQELLPYCNALDFEPFRDRKMSMKDEGYVGYRDEVSIRFCGITDSYIPLLRLPMSYYYDDEHEWPSERLYRYLVHTFFSDDKKTRIWGPHYGIFSLFC